MPARINEQTPTVMGSYGRLRQSVHVLTPCNVGFDFGGHRALAERPTQNAVCYMTIVYPSLNVRNGLRCRSRLDLEPIHPKNSTSPFG